jgi:hypothetical protein
VAAGRIRGATDFRNWRREVFMMAANQRWDAVRFYRSACFVRPILASIDTLA